MPTPRKLVIYLIGGIVAFVVLWLFFRDRFGEIAILMVFGFLLADGLVSGETSFGRGSSRMILRRSERPVAYWCVIAVLGAMTAAVFALLLFATSPPKT